MKKKNNPIKSDRFVCAEISGGAFASSQQHILVDKRTGVNYLWTTGGYAGGLTVLVDADGKPIVTPISTTEEQ